MKLTEGQIRDRLSEALGWEQRDQQINRMFKFGNFRDSIAFVNKVADIAEELDHHPDIFISYQQVQLSVCTHSEGGLTEKDFEFAKKVNKISPIT